jgi:PAS domain S-box-containing protein
LGLALVGLAVLSYNQYRQLARLKRQHVQDSLIFRSCPLPLMLVRENDRFVMAVSDSLARILDSPPGELLERPFSELTNWLSPEDLKLLDRELQKNDNCQFLECTLRFANGKRMPVSLAARRVHFENQACLLVSLNDLTSYREVQEELHQSTTRFLEFADFLPEIELETDLAGEIIFANLAASKMSGFTREELAQHLPATELFMESDRAEIKSKFKQIIGDKSQSTNAYRFRRKDGTHFPVAVKSMPITQNGQTTGLRHLLFDLSEKFATQKALAQVTERYTTVVDNAFEPIFQIEGSGLIRFMNHAMAQLLQGQPRDFIGKNIATLWPGNPDLQAKTLSRHIASQQTQLIHVEFFQDGDKCKREINIQPLQGEEPDTAICFVSHPASSGKLPPESAAMSYQGIFEAANDAFLLQSLASNSIVDANPKASELYGHKREEFAQLSLEALCAPTLPYVDETIADFIERANQGTPQLFDWQVKTKNGSLLWVEFNLKRTSINGQDCLLAIARDIARRKQLEEHLQRRSKLDAISELAGGIAHDFNELLAKIIGGANILSLGATADSPVRENAESIQKAAEEAVELTRELTSFSQTNKPPLTSLDMHSLITETASVLKRKLGENISLLTDLNAADPQVTGNEDQLRQTILNLGLNARDAMAQEGGELTITTEIVDLDADYCREHMDSPPGRYLMLALTDTGCGIPKENQAQIFDPFYSTKKLTKSTGLGLAMVYRTVRNHGGTVQVYSEVDYGTTFRIYLPSTNQSHLPANNFAANGNSGRLLVIDDEELALHVAEQMLRTLGYTVTSFLKPSEAIAHYQEHQAEIDLVLVDFIMPEMNGDKCFQALRALNPEAKVFLTSGYALDSQTRTILQQGFEGFLPKPFILKELQDKLSQALNG